MTDERKKQAKNCQLISSCYIKSVGFPNKAVNIIQGFECFLKEHSNGCVCFPELHSLHRETDEKKSMHAVYVDWKNNNTVCVVADDADICLSLINVSHYIHCQLLIFIISYNGKTRTRM